MVGAVKFSAIIDCNPAREVVNDKMVDDSACIESSMSNTSLSTSFRTWCIEKTIGCGVVNHTVVN